MKRANTFLVEISATVFNGRTTASGMFRAIEILATCVIATTFVGCGAGSNSGSTSTPPPPAPAAPAVSEYLYTFYNDGSLRRSSLDSVTGLMGPQTSIQIESTYSPFNLELQPRPMGTPDGKFLYLAEVSSPPQTYMSGAVIAGFSILDGTIGTISGTNPYVPSTPLNQVTGAVMDGRGRFIYISDQNGGYAPYTSTFQSYLVNATTGALSGGPIFTQSGTETFSLNAADPLGRNIYGYVNTASSLSLTAYAINPTTGALSPVPGSPYTLLPNPMNSIYSTPNVGLSILVSSSGKFVYVPAFVAPIGPAPQENLLFVYAVDSSTGALSAISGSPFSLGNVSPASIALHPNGKFMFVSAGGSPGSELTYALDPQTGAPSSTPFGSLQADGCCGSYVLDPDGGVLIGVTSPNNNSLLVDATTAKLTLVQSQDLFNDYLNQSTASPVSAVIVKNP